MTFKKNQYNSLIDPTAAPMYLSFRVRLRFILVLDLWNSENVWQIFKKCSVPHGGVGRVALDYAMMF
jgi:hypothetical protein